MDERLRGNKYNVRYHPHGRYIDTAGQCSSSLLKDAYGWPGDRIRSPNVGPVPFFTSGPRFSKCRALQDGTQDGFRQCVTMASESIKPRHEKCLSFPTLFQLLQGESFRWGPMYIYIINIFLHRFRGPLLNREAASHRPKPWQATASC